MRTDDEVLNTRAELRAALKRYMKAYGFLHDAVSELVEDGRLKGVLPPEEHEELVGLLEDCEAASNAIKVPFGQMEADDA